MTLDLAAFRFGIDELTESTHGWLAAQDTDITQSTGVTFLIRLRIQETTNVVGGNAALQFQYNKNGAGWNNITTTSAVIKAVAAVAFVEAANCTVRLTGGTGTFESTGFGCTVDGLSGGNNLDIPPLGFTETECSVQIVSAGAVTGDAIQIRFVPTGSPVTYSLTPAITVFVPTLTSMTSQAVAAATTTTTGATPAADSTMLVVAAAYRNASDAGVPVISSSPTMSWTEITSVSTLSGSGRFRLYAWYALPGASPSSTTVTIDSTSATSIGVWVGYDTNTSTDFSNVATDTDTAGDPVTVLGSTPNADSTVLIAVVGLGIASLVRPSGYILLASPNPSSSKFDVMFDPLSAGTTATWSSTLSDSAALAIELKVPTLGTAPVWNPYPASSPAVMHLLMR